MKDIPKFHRLVRIKLLKGFEDVHDYYWVSSEGIVYGENGAMRSRLVGSQKRYLGIGLSKGQGVVVETYVHNLVALAFLRPDKEKTAIRHRNGNTRDNRLENLERVLPGEQFKYETSTRIKATHVETGEVLYFNSVADAGRAGFTQSSVGRCIRKAKGYKKHKNFKWERA